MSFTFAEPQFVKISYRTFDRMGTDGLPCGAFMYYAKPEVAFDSGLYVEMFVSQCEGTDRMPDFMGDKFTVVHWSKTTPVQRQLYMHRIQSEWHSRVRSAKLSEKQVKA